MRSTNQNTYVTRSYGLEESLTGIIVQEYLIRWRYIVVYNFNIAWSNSISTNTNLNPITSIIRDYSISWSRRYFFCNVVGWESSCSKADVISSVIQISNKLTVIAIND